MNEHILDLIRSKTCRPFSFYIHHDKYPQYLEQYQATLSEDCEQK